MQYLDLTEHRQVKHISSISRIEEEHYVWLDKFTIRNLELFHPLQEGGKAFIDIIDHTISPMGARLLKRWIAMPLKDILPIRERLDAVENFIGDTGMRNELEEQIARSVTWNGLFQEYPLAASFPAR